MTTPGGAIAILMASIISLIFPTFGYSLDRDRTLAQLHYTFWSEKDGAPSEISALAQTEDGYLWIGSARGLFRFDGVTFEEYRPQPGVEMPSHNISSLMATPDGGLWIAFEPNGLGFYKDGALTVFTRRDQLPSSPAHCFARDNDGRIWAGTETGLEFRQGDRWVSVGPEWNFTPEMIRYLFVDREGTLWVATVKRILYLKRDSKTFKLGGPIGTGVTTLGEGAKGRVWLADDGSYEVRPVPTEGHNPMARGPSIAADGLHELLFDKDGALWITREDSGIVRITDPGKLEPRVYGPKDREVESYGPKDGFPVGYTYKLLEDREGNIWVGCSNGLIRIRQNQVVPVRLPQRYERLTLLAGMHGELTVGTTNSKPLLKIQGNSIVAEKGGSTVSSVFRDAGGDAWWGSRAGIWRQRGSDFTFFHLPKDAVPDWMWDIMATSDNRGMWVKLGDVGLVRFNQGDWNLHDWPAGVPSVGGTFKYGPSASFRDASGRFWLGYTSGQIFLVDGHQATEYSQKDGLDLGRIKVIRGEDSHIWAGGELGLALFSKGRFWKVHTVDGEPFGAVSGIIETPDSGLWLNEMKGIVQIPREVMRQVLVDPGHPVSYRRFDYLDGLPGSPQMSFTNSTAVRTTDGGLWFATDNGLAWIDPTHMLRNENPPPVSILSISGGNGRKVTAGPAKFAAGTHTVEIDYAGLSLSIPERVKFRVKLDGIDPDWQDVGTRRQAYYNNLGPGSYQFRVIACNNDGVWNETGASIEFFIAPAYYQRDWFRVACSITLLALVWMLHQLRSRHLTRRSQQLAAINANLAFQINERKRVEEALTEAQMELTRVNQVILVGETAATIAHEVNQPLAAAVTNAKTGLRWLAAHPPEIEEAREALGRIVSDSMRAAEVIRRIRSLVGRAPLRKEPLNVNEAIHEAILLVDGEIRKNQVSLKTQLRDQLPQILADRIQLQQVLLNLIRNAVEAMSTERLRELEIESQLADSQDVRITVRDSGPGLDPKAADKLFNHFYTTKADGMGMGLTISRSIVEAHGGQLWVTANLPRGAVFHFTLPIEE